MFATSQTTNKPFFLYELNDHHHHDHPCSVMCMHITTIANHHHFWQPSFDPPPPPLHTPMAMPRHRPHTPTVWKQTQLRGGSYVEDVQQMDE
jgi:hypothetical protein